MCSHFPIFSILLLQSTHKQNENEQNNLQFHWIKIDSRIYRVQIFTTEWMYFFTTSTHTYLCLFIWIAWKRCFNWNFIFSGTTERWILCSINKMINNFLEFRTLFYFNFIIRHYWLSHLTLLFLSLTVYWTVYCVILHSYLRKKWQNFIGLIARSQCCKVFFNSLSKKIKLLHPFPKSDDLKLDCDERLHVYSIDNAIVDHSYDTDISALHSQTYTFLACNLVCSQHCTQQLQ